jgi:hypothetical protein
MPSQPTEDGEGGDGSGVLHQSRGGIRLETVPIARGTHRPWLTGTAQVSAQITRDCTTIAADGRVTALHCTAHSPARAEVPCSIWERCLVDVEVELWVERVLHHAPGGVGGLRWVSGFD